MSRGKQVQIHYRHPDGRKGVMNYLWGDNSEVGYGPDRHKRLEKLRDKALRMAGQWHSVYPETTFTVVEVDK